MKLIDRPHYINQLVRVMNTPEIKIITGVRRCGKSKLMASFAEYIRRNDPDANIIIIDLTKIRFEGLKEYHALSEYVEARYQPEVNNYVMIDEVQMCQNFELTINSLHSNERYDIYLTGSNAFLLSSDLATLFTGRHIEIPVFPFSFSEFCQYFELTAENPQYALDRYTLEGGFAGSYSYKFEADREKYVRDVYNTILLRDLVDKYKLGSSTVLSRLGNYLMDNISNVSSIRNISNGLVTDGVETNHKTVGSYVNYLCEAFIFYEAGRYDVRGKTYLQSMSKYYLVDTSIRIACLGKRNMDWGRMYENMVYIELLRRGYEVYVGKLYQKEVDFVVMRGNEKIYIQVSDNIDSSETLQREISPLIAIRDAYPKLLIARTRHEEYDIEGIKVIDLAHWLLDSSDSVE